MRRATGVLLAGLLAIGACFFAWVQWRRAQRVPPPTAARLAELRTERDRLQAVFRAAVLARGEQSLAEAPVAGVMIGIPTILTSSIVEQVVTGLFGETTLTLKNLKVHKEGKVRAKMLIRKRTLGEFVLDVNIHQVQGILKPGKPTLVFGTSTVDLTLPVRLAEGKGSAELRFQWDSKGLAANTVCGDVDVTREVGAEWCRQTTRSAAASRSPPSETPSAWSRGSLSWPCASSSIPPTRPGASWTAW